ncbi:hypothetical protein [Mucilaginibacter sp. dw_454]|uniref:hypothetical protein n=1 Tax=Mucilaginibacter sp. dw_454 TaxID=2720079 RepID=UPI001BD30A8B|nr:hypothetical protein [Mucilaginibacter sp. dw_454]
MNTEELKEGLYRKGFGESLNSQLDEAIKSGKPEFQLEHAVKIGEDDVNYKLHFRRDDERDKVYFNKYDVAITNPDRKVTEHTFPTEKLITAMEAYRLLTHGELVAVNKNLYNKEGQQYNTWISIDTTGKKDDYNNYPVNSYHENYYQKQPFELKDSLKKLSVPVKELENPQTLERIEKSLKKANLVPVTIMVNGEQTSGTLAVNPKIGRVDLYDQDMRLVERQQQKAELKAETPGQNQDDLKKKPWENQRVNWESKNQRKGMSI